MIVEPVDTARCCFARRAPATFRPSALLLSMLARATAHRSPSASTAGRQGRERRCMASKGGSENGHVVRRVQAVRRERVVHRASEVRLRKRAARFPERLYPTATVQSSSRPVARTVAGRDP
jgi:hypothetical protein